MSFDPPELLLVALATWRISHMLVYEEGPFGLLTAIRSRFGVEHDSSGYPVGWPVHSIFACVWCVAWYVGAVLLLCWWAVPAIVVLAAIAAVVAFLAMATDILRRYG